MDLLVWFEIEELANNGEYIPVHVDHHGTGPGSGVYLLRQGLQRRIAITVHHDPGNEVVWREVHELVVGRIRNTPEWTENDSESTILSLSLLPARYIQKSGDNTMLFRFEAAWDSSLHDSPLLNRITPHGEKVYVTISAYYGLENCAQPVCITKDLCMLICSRDLTTSTSRFVYLSFY